MRLGRFSNLLRSNVPERSHRGDLTCFSLTLGKPGSGPQRCPPANTPRNREYSSLRGSGMKLRHQPGNLPRRWAVQGSRVIMGCWQERNKRVRVRTRMGHPKTRVWVMHHEDKGKGTLAGVAQWIECWPVNQRVASLIPSQGTCLGCGAGPL